MKKLSPFGFFRDHQRMFLAVFGVLILVVFTVGPSLQSYQSTQGGGGGNAPVVQWNQWSFPYLGKIWIVGRSAGRMRGHIFGEIASATDLLE